MLRNELRFRSNFMGASTTPSKYVSKGRNTFGFAVKRSERWREAHQGSTIVSHWVVVL